VFNFRVFFSRFRAEPRAILVGPSDAFDALVKAHPIISRRPGTYGQVRRALSEASNELEHHRGTVAQITGMEMAAIAKAVELHAKSHHPEMGSCACERRYLPADDVLLGPIGDERHIVGFQVGIAAHDWSIEELQFLHHRLQVIREGEQLRAFRTTGPILRPRDPGLTGSRG